MFSWLLVNVVLSALALLFVTVNASAPHRLRFLISFVALCAWLVPWHVVPEFVPQWQALDLWEIERRLAVNTAEYSLRPVVIMTTGLPLAASFFAFTWVQLGFITLCATGLLLFSWHLCRHQLRLRQLRRNGEDGASLLSLRGLTSPVPVVIQSEIAGAFSSGLVTPRIWIHKELADSTQLATLLRHELTHIRQHDNWYLLCITLVEKLFWWNPLVWLLGRQARELQELSCDVLCQQASADYPLDLAELMIDNARLNPVQGSMLLSANIFNKTNLNIKRIKLLQRSYSMKPRHLVSTFVTAVGAIATIGIVTAQPEAGENQRTVIRGQSVQLAADRSSGDVVFVARDPSAQLTEEELAAFENGQVVMRAADTVMLHHEDFTAAIPGTPGVRTMGWHSAAAGAADQFIKVNGINGDLEITLNFTDAPLSMILEPLANMAVDGGLPSFGVAAIGTPPGTPGPGPVVTRQIIQGSVTSAAVASTSADEVVMFHAEPLPPGAVPFTAPVAGATVAAMPFKSKLLIEDEADGERLVSVDAENVSIQEALEIIGAEANCNIFMKDDMIVVNSCAN
jgi:beta-lactamase regulating signal transducer with metallopeptidase domain